MRWQRSSQGHFRKDLEDKRDHPPQSLGQVQIRAKALSKERAACDLETERGMLGCLDVGLQRSRVKPRPHCLPALGLYSLAPGLRL